MSASAFEDFGSLEEIIAEQQDLIEVFLEGPDDLSLFAKFWFLDYLDRVEFKRPRAGDGCEAVVLAVEEARRRGGVPAYGIVDRDVWRRRLDIDAFLDGDDRSYRARRLADGVHVTLYWEIEAYLLYPDGLDLWISTMGRTAPRLPCTRDEMIESVSCVCACLFEIMELNVFLHHLGIAELDRFEYGASDPGKVQAVVREKVVKLAREHGTSQALVDRLQRLVSELRTAASARGGDEHVEYLLRFVDSKALIDRVAKRFDIKDSRIWQLAQNMNAPARRPAELKRFLDDVCAARAPGS